MYSHAFEKTCFTKSSHAIATKRGTDMTFSAPHEIISYVCYLVSKEFGIMMSNLN